jgi:chemotaxis protein MotB
MSDGKEDTPRHELVIIRRRGPEDDAPHKGGVWKIAHADFMTALMAFFLVMWLINATDSKTATGIANYFNPMRLSDTDTKPKGVFTMEPSSEHEGNRSGAADKPSPKLGPKGGKKFPLEVSEAELMSEPYVALDELAAQADTQPNPQSSVKKEAPAHHTGEAFRDPFDPDFQRGPLPQGVVGGKAVKTEAESMPAADHEREASDQQHAPAPSSEADHQPPAPAASSEPHRDGERSASDEQHAAPATSGESAHEQPGSAASSEPDRDAERTRLAQSIEEAVRQSGAKKLPGIEVVSTNEGLLISITDQFDFGMFAIASAQPRPELVVMMDKIGKVLADRSEPLVIRGYTDGRPFRSKDYDNWRLSTARAHMANYMLVRSGIPDSRIARIEGHADRDLKVPGDPLAAPNRRIEILLVRNKP